MKKQVKRCASCAFVDMVESSIREIKKEREKKDERKKQKSNK